MIIGQEYYRRYKRGTKILYLSSYIKKIEDGIAYLANGKRFEVGTGLECDTDESYIWEPCTPETSYFIKRRNKANKARKWFKRVTELDEVAINLQLQLNTDSDLRRYYHHISKEERDSLKDQTVAYIRKNYKQPYWCGHQQAFEGIFGCKKLISGEYVSAASCMLCNCYVRPYIYKIWERLRVLAKITPLQMNKYLHSIDYESVEMGCREPTEKEFILLKSLFGMDKWTMRQCEFFLDTEGTENRKDDPYIKKWGEDIRAKVNFNSIFYEDSNIKNW